MRTSTKKNLIKEQNKSLIMICVIIIIVIGVYGLYFYIPSLINNTNSTDSVVDEDGIVNDLEGFRNR